jgi:hypothetical protein
MTLSGERKLLLDKSYYINLKQDKRPEDIQELRKINERLKELKVR